MQAEGIRKGDRHDAYDAIGRVVGGWTATGDAVVEGNTVYVPVRFHDGSEDTKVWHKGEQVALTWGVGNPAETMAKAKAKATGAVKATYVEIHVALDGTETELSRSEYDRG